MMSALSTATSGRFNYTDKGSPITITGCPATASHPIHSITRQSWVPAIELRAGEVLLTRDGVVTLRSLINKPGPRIVCNLEVATDHCYYVGDGAALVHNSCAANTPLNTQEFMFADNSRSAAEFTRLADDIVANGMQNKMIHYTEIDGLKYVLLGNDRLRFAEWFMKTTGDLIFERVGLPFRGFKTEYDVV